MNLQRRALSLVVGGLTRGFLRRRAIRRKPRRRRAAANADAAVQIIADGCSQVEVHGAGLMVAAGRIATVAHVVAGAKQIEVRGANGSAPATVVYFDPILDVAVLEGRPRAGRRRSPSAPRHRAITAPSPSIATMRPSSCRPRCSGWSTFARPTSTARASTCGPGTKLTLDIQAGDSGAVVVVGRQGHRPGLGHQPPRRGPGVGDADLVDRRPSRRQTRRSTTGAAPDERAG